MQAMSDEVLKMWVIYDHPRDFPDCFVARLWHVKAGVTEATIAIRAAGTLSEVRGMLPMGLVNIGRRIADEPQIVEVWV
jgi:hypothetical protein